MPRGAIGEIPDWAWADIVELIEQRDEIFRAGGYSVAWELGDKIRQALLRAKAEA